MQMRIVCLTCEMLKKLMHSYVATVENVFKVNIQLFSVFCTICLLTELLVLFQIMQHVIRTLDSAAFRLNMERHRQKLLYSNLYKVLTSEYFVLLSC